MARLPRLPNTRTTRGDDGSTTVTPRSQSEQSSLRRRIGRRAGGQESTIAGELKRRLYRNFLGTRKPLTSMNQFLKDRRSMGMFGQAMSPNISNVNDITIPALIDPKVVASKPTANINTLVTQLNALLKVAQQVGALSLQQQNLLVEQIKQAKRIAKEAQMEARPDQAEMVESDVTATDSLAPLDDAMDDLRKSVKSLIDVINEKINTKCDCESLGSSPALAGPGSPRIPGGLAGSNPSKAPKAGPKPNSSFMDAKLKRNYGADIRMGRRGREDIVKQRRPDLYKRVQRRTGGQEGTYGAELKRRLRANFLGDKKPLSSMADYYKAQRNKGGGSAVAQKAKTPSLAVANTISTGAKQAGKGTAVAVRETAVAKVARPILEKALGSTALKSIPVIGAAAGGVYAAGRLLEGDVVGAGLDLTSGLGGPLTAIPALIASAARDVYSSMFGIQPEQDPAFGPKMAMITSVIGSLAKAMLASKVDPVSSATGKKLDAATPGSLAAAGVGGAALATAKPTMAQTAPPQTGGGAPAGGGGAPAGGGSPSPAAAQATPTGGGGGSISGSPAAPASSGTPAASEGAAATPTAKSTVTPPPAKATPSIVEQMAAENNVPITSTPGLENITQQTAAMLPKIQTDGQKLSISSMFNELEAQYTPLINAFGDVFKGSKGQPTAIRGKTGSKGMSDVPDPISPDMASIAGMCWFTSRV